ncbi:protein of unknown function DUF820 [Thalassoporum mexicanum PCC 7367]|uniref:Uma2 family endonuclease n=1 Tax=Thalassoporum mexicanum TaxID=3457544 RepID=UPI00029FAC17|nr:Uma2 family endonuclease [Pseudanabaena sp. PCC 7367]AFY70402.1 protein of unknown function DUF820 [Pseudanabaena sp. PCC 7367]
MVEYNALLRLPSSDELPDSDDTPVDNEIQYLFASLLWGILSHTWSDRQDWFLGANMGIYYDVDNPRIPIVPDCFLSLGVTRHKGEFGRKSYVLWEENYTAPVLAIEHISHAYNGEYDLKMQKYIKLGVLYYIVYNPEFQNRDQHEGLEVYRLTDGIYNRYQAGQEPVWMPEVGLGIGRDIGIFNGWEREWLFWYDQDGNRYPSPVEVIQQQETQNAKLLKKLQELGIDPDTL